MQQMHGFNAKFRIAMLQNATRIFARNDDWELKSPQAKTFGLADFPNLSD
jgi:hypothetical protein